MKYRRNFILLLCLVFSACAPATGTSSPQRKTPTVIPVTRTRRPTNTPAATQTDQPFRPMPTSTYMAPTPLAGTHYRLKQWTPELTNTWIETLRTYPENLGIVDRGYHDSGYYWAYDIPAFAEREAQLRFPRSQFAQTWAWDASYSMAQYGDDDTLESYVNLIIPALNDGITTISQLESWFKAYETRMTLKVSPMAEKPKGYVVEIADNSASYGGYLWLVNKQGKFSAYPLPARGGYGDFKASSAVGISFALEDVTGDGIAEIITTHQHFPGSGDALTTGFNIFDVSHGAPDELLFTPQLSSGRGRKWSVIKKNGKGIGLAFDFTFDRMICPFIEHYEYRWNGKEFERTQVKYPDRQQIIDEVGVGCLDPLLFLLGGDLSNGKPESLKRWDDFISGWPYSNNESGWIEGAHLPDARDKQRFIVGLGMAFAGRVDDARHEMDIIVKNPVVPDSSWVAPAKNFLASFHTPDDLSKTCLALKQCGAFMDEDELIKLAGTTSSQATIDFLRQMGLQVIVASSLDINNDGLTDQQVNIGKDADHLSEWLFIAGKDQYQALSLRYYGSRGIKSLQSLPAFEGSPVFRMETNDDIALYTIAKDPDTSEVYVSKLCDEFSYTAPEFEHDLLNGSSPATIAQKTSVFLPKLKFACQNQPYLLGRVQYVLGMAYELSGDAPHAAENYLAVWQLYPDSPFAWMAQTKLEAAP